MAYGGQHQKSDPASKRKASVTAVAAQAPYIAAPLTAVTESFVMRDGLLR